MARHGYYHGAHAAPPCATWSKARWAPGGPPPVRDRDRPWGLPGLTTFWTMKVAEANALLLAAVLITKAVAMSGGSCTLEHPADPGPPMPSIWGLDLLDRWRKEVNAETVTFPQCMWGASVRKLTTIAGAAQDLQAFDRACNHVSHQALLGLDATGKFKTRAAQAYPGPLSERLARCHALFMLLQGHPLQEGTFVQLDEVLEVPREELAAADAPLPASFLRHSG
jgi:hypothetical protein